MALKFLNKKGWHTGSLRNLENVWKAEQKHDAEQKKLEELKTQLHKEREAEELRQLHIDAGLAPKQDRLEFLYDSGLGVGGGASASSSKPSVPDFTSEKPAVGSAQKDSKLVQEQSEKASVGALFQETKQSANDKWRKIHSDPLYLIKQQELAALDRIRKNPVRMQMLESEIRKKLAPDKKSKSKSEKSDKHHKKKKKHKRDEERDDERDEEDSRHKKKSRHERRHERRSPEVNNYGEERHRRGSPETNGSGELRHRRRNPESDDSGDHRLKRKNAEMNDFGESRRKRRSPEIDDSGDYRQERKNLEMNDYREHRRKRSPGINDSYRRPRDDSPRKRHKSSHTEMGSTSRVPKRHRSADSDDNLERTPSRMRRTKEGGSDDSLERSGLRKRKHRGYGSSDSLERTDSRRRKHRRDSPDERQGDTSYDRSHGSHHHERRDAYRHRNDSQ